jgi:hypothetical protein
LNRAAARWLSAGALAEPKPARGHRAGMRSRRSR